MQATIRQEQEFIPEGTFRVDQDSLECYEKILTVADPFPVYHGSKVIILAEIEGLRSKGKYFKKLGYFELDYLSSTLVYQGELWPEDDGEYSFPFLYRHDDHYLLIPDVNRCGLPQDKLFRIYKTYVNDFPHGWELFHESELVGAKRPSDKVLIKKDGLWYLFVSDAGNGGQLLLYFSEDMSRWNPHPGNSILKRQLWVRLLNKFLPYRYFRIRPWRLGGGALCVNGQPTLCVQHQYQKKVYGEAVSLLYIDHLDEKRIKWSLSFAPILKPDTNDSWRNVGAHHIALANCDNRIIVLTDGFNGKEWTISGDWLAENSILSLPTG